jgi:hypothetical protein
MVAKCTGKATNLSLKKGQPEDLHAWEVLVAVGSGGSEQRKRGKRGHNGLLGLFLTEKPFLTSFLLLRVTRRSIYQADHDE